MKKKVLTITLTLVFLAVFSVAFFFIYTDKPVLGEKTDIIWDGSTIATSFSGGNGTEGNPYLIKNGEELAYLQKLLGGDQANNYNNLYYELTDDINLGSHELGPISTETAFSGFFNGKGHTIENISIVGENKIEGTNYYGLFGNVDNGSINNLNISGIKISVVGNGITELGVLAGKVDYDTKDVKEKNSINNISIRGVDIDLSEATLAEDSNVGLLVGEIGKNYNFTNITVSGKLASKDNKHIGILANSINSDLKNVVYSLETELEIQKTEVESNIKLTNIYEFKDNKYYLEDKEVDTDDILKELNKDLKDYEWSLDKEDFILELKEEVNGQSDNKGIIKPKEMKSAAITLHNTGKDNGTVYLNDLESDEDFYEGQNYTDWKTENTIPDFTNKNLYNTNNLAKIYIRYSGASIDDSTIKGYVSNDELYSDFIYYKYYPIEDGKVKIPLIDNPYAYRPRKGNVDLVFNGWITDYTGAVVSIDMETYDRYVTIPAPANPSTATSITMYAVWTKGKVYQMTSSQTLATAERGFTTGMVSTISTSRDYGITDFSIYYLRRTADRWEDYPRNSYDENGDSLYGDYCRSRNGCTYYIQAPSTFDPDEDYYRLQNGYMSAAPYTTVTSNFIEVGKSTAGYFRQKTISGSRVGYYNEDGEPETGTCNNCTVYELIPYYDQNNNPNVLAANDTSTYYYLTTRDTNIVVLRAALNYSNTRFTNTKPLTVTSLHNGNDYRSDGSMSMTSAYVYAQADLRIEYVRPTGNINANASNSTYNSAAPPSSLSSRSIFGNYQNLKVGRGISFSTTDSYVNFQSVIAGNVSSTGSSSSLTKYKMIVESGESNQISVTGGANSSSTTQYVDGVAVLGCDFDRASNANNLLHVYHATAAGWGGNLRSSSTAGVATQQIVKSGSYGTSKNNYSCGVYVGGRGSSGSYHYSAREAIIEGGYIFNLIGGALANTNKTTNDAYIFVKGGNVDLVFGGAGVSETYGNRIIAVTGGQVNYGVFGGSNGTSGSNTSNQRGTLSGDTFVYIGGHALIGGGDSAGLYNVAPGTVYGAGNGNSSNTAGTIGSVNNSNVLINGGTIRSNVYGGGNFGAIGTNLSSGTTNAKLKIKAGTISGSVYGGGNNNGAGTTNVTASIDLEMSGGTVSGSVYGGSCVKGTIYGSTTVKVTGGTISEDVYGGGEGGYRRVGNTTYDGTYVARNVTVTIGDNDVSTTPSISGNVYGGSAYGSVNGTTNNGSATATYRTTVTVNKGTIVGDVFGGGKGGTEDGSTYTPKEYGDITVSINGGSIGRVFGGNDQMGSPGRNDYVYLNGGTIGSAFGGGNNTGQTTTNIYLQGSTITNDLYGGSNESGSITTTNVEITSGSVKNVFGGNNLGGTTTTSNVDISGGTITNNVYGGGNEVGVGTTHVDITGGTVGATIFGGSNQSGTVTTAFVTMNATGNYPDVYGGNNSGGTTIASHVTITKGNIVNVYGGGYRATTGSTDIDMTGGTVTNMFGGGNFADVTETDINITGGNLTNVFGGGNKANVTTDTLVNIQSATATGSVFGGGNQGEVLGNSEITIKNSAVNGSAYAGGNEADVKGNTTITVEGTSTIGTSSTQVPMGSVFGSGNSAGTGTASNKKTATVNIVGGTVYGNVYGGANTSVVNGVANVKIGTAAVNNNTLTEGNIWIKGTVYGGGESNAAGSAEYDYTAISVTEGINITINGDGYANNSHTFKLNGSIFGSGNASSSAGDSTIYIKKLGTLAAPNDNLSIQRTTYLTIDESVIHLIGATDITNKYSNAKYSFNLIGTKQPDQDPVGGLILKNNSTLLLDENANQLVSFYSGVDTQQGLAPATVTIDDSEQSVVKNTDNRVYMLANKNLNIATDDDATDYGKVTGMTFFGVYRNSAGNIHEVGVYDPSVYTYGHSATTADLVIASSYVLGLHHSNHDITKDGFYTNYLEEDTNFSQVRTGYIHPTPPDVAYYRWQIGTNSIEYEFTMTASKYLSMGTNTLSLIDFPNGDTTFHVLDFDDSELDPSLTMVEETQVPKFARVGSDESKKFGLNMKSESTEWTSSNKTSFVSDNNGEALGDKTYLTSSDAGAPNLQFYLYHAKNIEMEGDLGTVVITMDASTPKNGYEVDLKMVTIRINIEAINYSDGNHYDASISYGKKYSMPVTTPVNITPKSQFTEYFSLIANDEINDIYGNNHNYYRTLVSSYALPVGTTISMIDLSKDTPAYYYYEVDATNYAQKVQELATDNEISYRLSDFLAMDTTTLTNKYNDTVKNLEYYDTDMGMAYEEFLFIFDFKNTNITTAQLDNEMLFELRTNDDRTAITVLDKRLEDRDMVFNIHQTSNIALSQTISTANTNFYYDMANTTVYTTQVSYSTSGSTLKVIDTNYEASRMGVNIQLFDSHGTSVSSSMLSGTVIKIGNEEHYVDSDGVFRIKLANKVTNVVRNLNITVDSLLPAGEYTVKYSIIASSDGLHASNLDAPTYTQTIHVVNADNVITVSNNDKTKVFYADLGYNEAYNASNTYQIKYTSTLVNTNVRLGVYKRKTDVYNSTQYVETEASKIFSNNLPGTGSTTYPFEVSLPFDSSPYNVLLTVNPAIKSGTYKLVFKLCDNDQVVDTDEVYLIVKKPVVQD